MGKTGSAGNHGGRVRSDCLVEIELKASGGIDLELDSRVEVLYGHSIRNLVQALVLFYEIRNAKMRIKDSGALDFVLAARMEAAIKKVLPGETREFLLPDSRDEFPEPDPARYRFTRLYLPGNTPSMMLNAGIHKPDGIILDLEDSVAPGTKDEARILVRNALRALDFFGAERMVRINQLPLGLRDLEAVVPQHPDLVLVPKVESPETIVEVEEKIRKISPERKVLLMPILESALGIERSFEIATAGRNTAAMAIGLEDYTADIGVQRTGEGTESWYARSRLVNACKAAGIQAIDSVYSDVDNEEGLRDTVSRSRSMGFEGMGCIHPRQIPVILEAFRPSAVEVGKAAAIVEAFEEAAKMGLGVVSLGSKMIDAPVVKRARRTIEFARKMGLI
jgi:citrate lyase subunit beta/citryl-CoA lyase